MDKNETNLLLMEQKVDDQEQQKTIGELYIVSYNPTISNGNFTGCL